MNDDIKILAEKIMGWCVHDFPDASTQRSNWICRKCGLSCSTYPGENLIGTTNRFDPRNDDNDLMMLVDKFCNGRNVTIEKRTDMEWEIIVWAYEDKEVCSALNPDRREAMIQAMLKAVKEQK